LHPDQLSLQLDFPAPASESAAPAVVPVIIDVETTGTDRRNDQVIELCVQFGLEADAPSRTWRIKPSVAISPGAQAVHGISMEDLEDQPPFAAFADEIIAVFADAQVIVGYNLAFDLDMLFAEYERLSRTPFDLAGKVIVDAFRLWQQFEPRSLQHAHQKFVGDAFADAHSASADVAATGRVLQGMMAKFGLEGRDWRDVAKACDPEGKLVTNRSSWVGPSKHLQWKQDEDGAIVMTFGKHTGVSLLTVARQDRDYLRWVTEKDFSPARRRDLSPRARDGAIGGRRDGARVVGAPALRAGRAHRGAAVRGRYSLIRTSGSA
jgi:DNA polymerase-3 subunit epsilon